MKTFPTKRAVPSGDGKQRASLALLESSFSGEKAARHRSSVRRPVPHLGGFFQSLPHRQYPHHFPGERSEDLWRSAPARLQRQRRARHFCRPARSPAMVRCGEATQHVRMPGNVSHSLPALLGSRACGACIEFCFHRVCWCRAWVLWRAGCPLVAALSGVTASRLRTAPAKPGRMQVDPAGTPVWAAPAALRVRAAPLR